MKTFNEWKESHLEDNPKDQSLGHSELMDKFNEYIKTGLKKSDEPRREKQKRQPMTEYEVHLVDTRGNSLKSENIKAKSAESAYQAFVESIKPIPSEASRVNVFWGFLHLQSQDFALTLQDLDYEGHVEESSNSQKSEQRSLKANKIDERVIKLLEAQNEKLYEVTTLLKGIRLGIFLIILLAFGIPWIISTFSN